MVKASKGAPRCVLYIRTSSAANVGQDKDSESRQLNACLQHVKRKGYEVDGRFADPCVSGTDALFLRAGFATMVKYCTSKNIQIVVLESGDRFARDLIVQETGLQWLRELGLQVETAEIGVAMNDSSSAAVFLRQVLGAVHEFNGAQIRERLASGRQKRLEQVTADQGGSRSLLGNPKLGGPKNSFEDDPELYNFMKDASRTQNVNLTELSKRLKKHRPRRWCVHSGPNKGKAWSAKHVGKLLSRFTKGKDKANVKISKKAAIAIAR